MAFIMTGGITYYSVRVFTQSADEIVLPQLTGKNILYVLETLTNMGLNAKLHGTRYDDTVPRYAVISQAPKPGATIKKGRDVSLYISKGKKENMMPDLRQLPLAQALILLEKNEFQKGHISATYSISTKKDSVIAQYPESFSPVPKGSFCNLLISRGDAPRGMIMPDTKGLRLERALAMIEHLDLGIPIIISTENQNQTYGSVLSSTPQPGSYVAANTPITLVVNRPGGLTLNAQETSGSLILLTHSLDPGILNRHVRVETDMFGPIIELYNEYMKPGTDIQILIPPGIKTCVDIFIDNNLERTMIIDPWNEDRHTGETLLWESSPLQFYLPISPDLVKN
ncbi:PASTA domain-containing protein [Desulfobacula sp.]|uniref:PASTA domain-containing protein n=1 Tax=Desulfobacula sp. TaxID=2593537 RepID=UPI002616845A|nr:PASTA domain-containing protein [Desulfobacula sp.]